VSRPVAATLVEAIAPPCDLGCVGGCGVCELPQDLVVDRVIELS
jgi:hypothetical protein